MIALSERMQAVPASPIRKLAPLARAAARRGVHVLHLNIGQPDIKTPTQALAAIHRMEQPVLSYSPSEGNLSLRGKLSSYYAGFGISLSPEEIIVTTGGSEAIQFAFMACLDPGDEVIVTDPCYANYKAYAAICGATVRSVPTRIEDGFRLPPIDAFEAEITPRTRAILICNPNNPTGYLYSRREMLRLREIVLRHNLFLISDEVYRSLVYDGIPYLSIFDLPEMRGRCSVIDAVSKQFSMTGYRLGFTIGPRELIDTMTRLQENVNACAPLPSQYAAIAAYGPETDASYLLREYDARRKIVVNGIRSVPGLSLGGVDAAFYAFVNISATGMDSQTFAYELLKAQHVAVVPGLAYGDDFDGFIRIAFTVSGERLREAIDRLWAFVRRATRRKDEI